MTVISSYLSFPEIGWWRKVVNANEVVFDTAEHFRKMTARNRYRISGSTNAILLSVPLQKGRDQKVAMHNLKVYNQNKWQVQHWRTIQSVYGRSPFFQHYEPTLKVLFEKEYTHLIDFNRDSIRWVKQQLNLKFSEREADKYAVSYPEGTDLRDNNFSNQDFPVYYQVFEDRIGFQPNLSILDLLFSEGPRALPLLRQ